MYYKWEKRHYGELKTVDNLFFIRINTHLMWPYGHLYGKIMQEKEIVVDFYLECTDFVLHLTPGDYTSENAKCLDIPKDDYFQIMLKIKAYTDYDFSKKLYDDLREIYAYIKGDPNCNIDNLLNTTSNN